MTLVVAVLRRDSIWLLADRRLSFEKHPPKDDARKIAFLETADGDSILGYAGLGATALGTEPSDWMNAVLRGRNLPLEQSLRVLADAIQQQLPKHLIRFPANAVAAHSVIVPTFVQEEARLYTIDLVFTPDRKQYRFQYTRHVIDRIDGATPALALGGSGACRVLDNRRQLRLFLKLGSAHDRRVISSYTMSDQLAVLNDSVHSVDETVGNRCIIAWRYRKNGVHGGGGGHQFYTGTRRDSSSTMLPTIAAGMNVSGLIELITPFLNRTMDKLASDQPVPDDKDEINAALRNLANVPDKKLR